MRFRKILTIGFMATFLASSAGAEAELSIFGVRLGMSLQEVKSQVETNGLDYNELKYEPKPYFGSLTRKVDGKAVKVDQTPIIQNLTFDNHQEDPRPEQLNMFSTFHFADAKGQLPVYALKLQRIFTGAKPSKAEINDWIQQRVGGKEPSCVFDHRPTPVYQTYHRYLFDANGNIIRGKLFCADFTVPVRPNDTLANELAADPHGASYAVDFIPVWRAENPDVYNGLEIIVSDYEAMRTIIEDARSTRLSGKTSAPSDLNDM